MQTQERNVAQTNVDQSVGAGITAEKQTRHSARLCKQTYYWFPDDLKDGGCATPGKYTYV
jgi:hypothetical protein